MGCSTAFPAAATTTAAATTAPDKEQPAAAAGSSGAAACFQLPFPRFVAAGNRLRLPPSPPAAALLGAEASPATDVMAEEEPRRQEKVAGEGGDEALASSSSAAAVAAQEEQEVEQRMDRLWEDFNEDLALAQAQAARPRRRARTRGGSWRCDGMVADGSWSEPSSPSDAGSEPAGLGGCAPVMRPSSRAGGGARHYRRRAGTWVLLMRIFRRLFVVEKTISAAPAVAARQRSSTGAR